MATQSFKDLIVWQRAKTLYVEIHKAFKDVKDYSFRDQILRAALSVPNNIAEGYARRSDKAFKNFLFIAKGSVAEVESMLLMAPELDLINKEEQIELLAIAEEVSKLLMGFMKKLSAEDS
ncbi:MAG: four helix bundle protein [Candidatus Saccharimonadales bacterium]|jgi:four helix bundle protein